MNTNTNLQGNPAISGKWAEPLYICLLYFILNNACHDNVPRLQMYRYQNVCKKYIAKFLIIVDTNARKESPEHSD